MRWTVIVVILLAAILVPFFLFDEPFMRVADQLMRLGAHPASAAAGITALLAADVLLPIPSSVVSAGAGALLGFWRGTATVWTGMTAACLIGYAFGSRASAAARRFVGNAGMARAEFLSARYGDYALILCRPVPVLAEASVIVAGIVGRPPGRFVGLTALANLGVALGYAAIGAFSMRVDSFLLAFAGSLLVPGIGMLVARRWLTAKGGSPPGALKPGGYDCLK